MRRIEFRRVVWGSSLAIGLAMVGAAAPLPAQDAGVATGAQPRTVDRDDDRGLWGLVGLLGLAGLLGRRRHVDVVDTTARTRP